MKILENRTNAVLSKIKDILDLPVGSLNRCFSLLLAINQFDSCIKNSDVADDIKIEKRKLLNFRNKDFKNYNFSELNLSYTNLENTDLHGANLHGANLENANLHGANLHGANLENANLNMANLEKANLENANLNGANLENANLHGVNLHGAIYNDETKGISHNMQKEFRMRHQKDLKNKQSILTMVSNR